MTKNYTYTGKLAAKIIFYFLDEEYLNSVLDKDKKRRFV
jgi:hypothetical protein